MKLLMIISAAVLLTATSCGGSRADAVKYNNKIVDEQGKIISLILKLRTAGQEEKETLRLQVVEQSKSAAAVVRKMDGFRGDNSLRDAAVRMFDKYASAFENEYRRMLELEQKSGSGTVTKAEEAEYEEIGRAFTNMEKDYEEPFLQVQKKFAEKYKVRMTENEYQKDIDRVKD